GKRKHKPHRAGPAEFEYPRNGDADAERIDPLLNALPHGTQQPGGDAGDQPDLVADQAMSKQPQIAGSMNQGRADFLRVCRLFLSRPGILLACGRRCPSGTGDMVAQSKRQFPADARQGNLGGLRTRRLQGEPYQAEGPEIERLTQADVLHAREANAQILVFDNPPTHANGVALDPEPEAAMLDCPVQDAREQW